MEDKKYRYMCAYCEKEIVGDELKLSKEFHQRCLMELDGSVGKKNKKANLENSNQKLNNIMDNITENTPKDVIVMNLEKQRQKEAELKLKEAQDRKNREKKKGLGGFGVF